MITPLASYRLQLTPDFGFRRAAGVIPYLADLGVSHIYLSPVFAARTGSRHGYDGVDYNRLNPELGSKKDFASLVAAVASHGLGWIQDIVPNHMAYDEANAGLMDVLEKGRDSAFAGWFDIDWVHPDPALSGRLHAPFLGAPYARCLENGDIRVVCQDDRFYAVYFDRRLPLRAETRRALITAGAKQAPDGLNHPENIHDLDRILAAQHFRLRFWRSADREINYRRFFGLNDLICVRQEDPQTFEQTHTLVFGLVDEEIFSGLRIDHVDGLADPAAYLNRLHGRIGDRPIWVEKILSRDERLPADWPVAGTTGYEFATRLNDLFVRPDRADELTAAYHDFIGTPLSWAQTVLAGKRTVLTTQFNGELDNLAAAFKRLAVRTLPGRDLTTAGLRAALAELAVCFPVYRTYITAGTLSPADRNHLDRALTPARQRRPDLDTENAFLERALTGTILDNNAGPDRELTDLRRKAVTRLQQLTAPLAAKGMEDTALYNYVRLTAQNEVGAEPDGFACSLSEFHAFVENRGRTHPLAMNAGATHDSKRGEDVRARINVLSELPGQWRQHLEQWRNINGHCKSVHRKRPVPDANLEYLLYQTLVGTWPGDDIDLPAYTDRIKAYAVKAVREAKVYTSWLDPDPDYEALVEAFVTGILLSGPDNPFLTAFVPFAEKIGRFGRYNSLAQTLVRITTPGVPDFYQGAELWHLVLVDPDNRGEVDFDRRCRLLKALKGNVPRAGKTPDPLSNDFNTDEWMKLLVISRALGLRKQHPELFTAGDYLPLAVNGRYSGHVGAFARKADQQWAVAVFPRFLTGILSEKQDPLGDFWGDTALALPAGAPGKWHNVLTGEHTSGTGGLTVSTVLRDFPVGLLLGGTES